MSTTNRTETATRNRSNKTKKMSEEVKDIPKISHSIIIGIKNKILGIKNSIVNFFSKCSMLTHLLLILIPVSLLFIFFIIWLHIRFYDDLFRYNYYKGVKEEFLDGYITEINDMQSVLQTLIIKENYLDFENLLFFEIYFNELISLGLLDEENYTFPGISHNSDTLYEPYQNSSDNCEYTIPREEAKKYIDDRIDSLKELAKIYYYMLPTINYGYKFMNVTINQTYLLAYEFDDEANIIGNYLYFAFPKSDLSNKAKNFVVSHQYLNPMVSERKYNHTEKKDGKYYEENFFKKKDYDFRNYTLSMPNRTNCSFSNISLSHFNFELNGNITKSILSTLQLYINHGGKNYMINIIATIQEKEIRNSAIEYSTFIYTPDKNITDIEEEKYSDNSTFLISNQNFIEYSLSTINNQLFHYGLYDNKNNKINYFYKNGVFFDSFNLDNLSNPSYYYGTVQGYDVDLNYFSSLYLYAKIIQNIRVDKSDENDNNTKTKKDDDELVLNTYEDEYKITEICKKINLTKFINDLKAKKDYDCWDEQNAIYFDMSENVYREKNIFEIYSLPYCTCIPLYCLNNFKNLKHEKHSNDSYN